MAIRKNKKLLCFVDEHGAARSDDLCFGIVMAEARQCGSLDKCFSDLLAPRAKEIHAAELSDKYLLELLSGFKHHRSTDRILLLNKGFKFIDRSPILYANAVVSTLKMASRLYGNIVCSSRISNIDMILDVSQFSDHPVFDAVIATARTDGKFRAVNRVSKVDSTAARLLQLADVVAYSRKWITNGSMKADRFREHYGVYIA